MSPPHVSVAIPLYNKAPFIAATVRSALAQTFTDFEIVVVDDGSTDGGLAQLAEFRDVRLSVVQQKNAGVGAARTRAMREGRGRYVAFLDADDLWHPRHLAHLMELAERYPAAALFGNKFAEGTKLGAPSTDAVSPAQYRVVDDYFAECASGRMPLYTSSCMVLRDHALALGGFPAGHYCGEDLALWMRLAVDAPVAVSDFVGCYYRRGIDSLSVNSHYRNAPDISMTVLTEILEQKTDWSQGRRSAVLEYYCRLALAHCLDCLRAGDRDKAQTYLSLAAGTRTQRRRLWQARVLAWLPRTFQSEVFRLASRRRD
jgi:glycosyltransferase involved in cell wall biosynthesis